MTAVSTPRPLAARFIQARIEAGLTQEELAARVGCSVFSIGKYERGERTPRGPMLRRIALETAKTVPWFFSEDGVAAA